MVNPKIVLRTFGIRGADGNRLDIEETIGRQSCIFAIHDAQSGQMLTVQLNRQQVKAFFALEYDLHLIDAPDEQEPEVQDDAT